MTHLKKIGIQKIGIFGGSFDPVHMGHINIAQSAYQEFGLDEVWFVPAGHSPNKEESRMTPAKMRKEMVELAIRGIPYFQVCDIELASQEKSYTYRTLEKLNRLYPDNTFYFIMGADSLDYFEQWVHPEIICQNAIVLVAVRDEMDLSAIQQKIKQVKQLFPADIYPVSGGKTDISSSLLRQSLAKGQKEEIWSLLPDAVKQYIDEHQLYHR